MCSNNADTREMHMVDTVKNQMRHQVRYLVSDQVLDKVESHVDSRMWEKIWNPVGIPAWDMSGQHVWQQANEDLR